MRAAGFLVPALVAGLCGMVANCTPRDDLSAFSAGTRATDTSPLEPAGAPPDPAPSAMPPSATDGEALAVETPETTSSDTPAQPTDLAAGENPGGAEMPTPASSDPGGAADEGAEGEMGPAEMAPPAEMPDPPPAAVPPPAMPLPPAIPPPTTPPPPATQFRFVRLVADSDVTAGPLTSIAEFDVLGADGQPLDHGGWVASADSAEPTFVGGAPAALAIDGQATTMWHTPWFQVVPPPHPHFLQVDMGQARTVSGFRYLGRQDGAPDGRIAAYRFFVSADAVDWGEALLTGTLANTDQSQDVRIR